MIVLSNRDFFSVVNRYKLGYLIALICGIVFGTGVFNIISDSEKLKLIIYSDFIVNKRNVYEINRLSLFAYVFKERGRELIILLICGLTGYRRAFYNIYIFYLGFKSSMIVSLLTASVSMAHIFRFILLSTPQLIVYIIMIYYVVDLEREKKNLIIIFVLLIISTLLETYINPYFPG